METGIITEESLTSVLRNISQKRRQGLLEIAYPNLQLKLLFIQGRIAEVLTNLATPYEELVERFKRCGVLARDATFNQNSYADLFKAIQQSGQGDALDLALFKLAVKHRILEHVYSLDLGSGAYYTFKVQMVDSERDFSPMVSVGQVLLDLVEVKSQRQKFEGTFPASAKIERAEVLDSNRSDEEYFLCNLIGNGAFVQDVLRKSFLSTFHTQDGLISMYEGGLVFFADDEAEQETEQHEDASVISVLESSIDQAFEASAVVTEIGGNLVDNSVAAQEVRAEVPNRFKPNWSHSLNQWSNSLLHSNWVAHGVVWLFLAALLVLPWSLWSEAFMRFAH